MADRRPTIDDLTALVASAIEEVHATTPVRLAWRPRYGVLAREPGAVAGVVHVVGHEPSPRWVEPPSERVSAPVRWDLDDPWSDEGAAGRTLAQVCDEVSTLVQVQLWRRGLDPTWPDCPAHPGTHPLEVAGRAWTCRRGDAVVTWGGLAQARALLRRTPLPAAGPGALAEVVELVLADVRASTDLDLALVLDAGDPRRGEVVAASAPSRRVAVDAPVSSSISDWIWELPPEERPIDVPEGETPVLEEETVGITLWRCAHAVVDLVRDLLDAPAARTWPACPEHPGEHRLDLDQGAGNDDDTVLWWCPTGRPLAFVGELSAEQ